MTIDKALLYPIYAQYFDRLFQLIKEQKEVMGIEEIHIFLFEEDIVWNETTFLKYQKGILVSGGYPIDYEKRLKSFIHNQATLRLSHVDIPAYQIEEFMNSGTAYPIE